MFQPTPDYQKLIATSCAKKADIAPIQYDADSPFKYNNFVYRLVLPLPTTSEAEPGGTPSKQPGCVAIPDSIMEFIIRLTNPDASGMSKKNRVENEVAIINFVAAALSHFKPKVVPCVYSWGSAATEASQG